ncbi:hypothetical protein GE09DRAFT_398266 [Coniochaeta sp. 2T2.1]|nr:hypothetical protein GE09DRAFT_398266 [Coniochaeta sp. 2T2.1]
MMDVCLLRARLLFFLPSRGICVIFACQHMPQHVQLLFSSSRNVASPRLPTYAGILASMISCCIRYPTIRKMEKQMPPMCPKTPRSVIWPRWCSTSLLSSKWQ